MPSTLGCAALLVGVASGVQGELSNVLQRFDVSGKVVNSHSGSLYRFGETFYLYGTKYPNCTQTGPICDTACGYYNNTFTVYSSPDLQQWQLLSDNLVPAIAADNARIEYDEVNVGYCAEKGDYVMIFWNGNYGFHNSTISIARSPLPQGPFVLAPPIVAAGGKVISDTVALFVDDDGTAYVRYNTRDAPLRHVVERLTPDWSQTTGEYGVIFEKPDFPWYDGGGMFRRGDVYYVMLSFDCCFCQWGSDALVFVAPSPLGPWSPQSPQALASIHAAAALRRNRVASAAGLACNLTGSWSGSLGGAPIQQPNLFLTHDLETGVVSVTGGVTTTATYFPGNASIVFNSFPGVAPVSLIGVVGPYNNSASDPCSQLSWQAPYQPPGSYWCRYPTCHVPLAPPANWTNEVNYCADGTQPPVSVASMYINPCSQLDVNGVNFTIPAQQFSVSTLPNVTTVEGDPAFLYFGERFRSTPDGNKGHDFQYWAPLYFDPVSGELLRMAWQDNYTLLF